MNRIRLDPQAILLWLEVAALAALAFDSSRIWLVSCAGILLIFAALLSRGLVPALILSLAAACWWLVGNKTGLDAVSDIPVTFPVIAILLGIGHAFLGILSGIKREAGSPALVSRLSHLVVIVHFLVAGILFADRFVEVSTPAILGYLLSAGIVILAIDTACKLVVRLYTPRRHWAALAAPGAFFFFRWLGKEWRDCLPTRIATDDAFSIRLPEMWMWPTIRRSLPALILTSITVFWLSTSIHEIGVREKGVRQYLGSWEQADLAPGLHLSLPWPLGKITTVDTGRLHEIVLGFRSDPGDAILWERTHYEGEQMTLVGTGDDFLSISVPIFYRFERPADHLRSSADPEGLLRDLADRLLLALTIDRSAADIMTSAREDLRHELKERLQSELDQRKAGIRIAEVYLRDIHPPVPVAPFYQDVVAAIEEKEALIHIGEEYRADIMMRASGSSKATVISANSGAENRLLAARGDAARFGTRSKARSENVALHDVREGFRVFDATLGGAKKAIFDEKMRAQMPTHLDLRKVLNPDLISTAPTSPQLLVPRPGKVRDPFQLEIEGYLKAGQGEVPAADFTTPDSDNLLEKP